MKANVPSVTLRQANPAVAVLIDAGTGSSGEVIAVAFKGRPRTWFIGQPTAGVSTTNQGFRLPDGANMVITVGTYIDRTGATYGKPVEPDQILLTPIRGPSMLKGDPMIAAALGWLSRQPCAG